MPPSTEVRATLFELSAVEGKAELIAERIHSYRSDDPSRAVTFARGSVAEAEPAVPGWRIAADEVFGPVANG